MTRLRFVLKDEGKAKVKDIEKLPSVKGTFTNAGQFQVIIGNQVKAFYDDFVEVSGVQGVSKEEAKKAAQQNMSFLQRLISGLAEIFVPILPAIITGGLILGFRNVIGDMKVFGDGTQALTDLYPVLAEIHSFLWILEKLYSTSTGSNNLVNR